MRSGAVKPRYLLAGNDQTDLGRSGSLVGTGWTGVGRSMTRSMTCGADGDTDVITYGLAIRNRIQPIANENRMAQIRPSTGPSSHRLSTIVFPSWSRIVRAFLPVPTRGSQSILKGMTTSPLRDCRKPSRRLEATAGDQHPDASAEPCNYRRDTPELPPKSVTLEESALLQSVPQE